MSWFKQQHVSTKKTTNDERNSMDKQQPGSPGSADIYMLPKDMREVHRLDFQHYLLRQVLKSNYLAPVQHPSAILDVACGTGRWIAEMGTEFPQSRVVGIDKTQLALQHATLPLPPNCSIQEADITSGLPFSFPYFDFVHLRFSIFAITLPHWPSIVQELVRVTRPGGWVELVDPDLTFAHQGPETTRMLQWLAQASAQRGLDTAIGLKLGQFLYNAGLANITVQKVPIPLGYWGGRIGYLQAMDFYETVRTLKPLVMESTHTTSEAYDYSLEQWLLENNEYYTSCDFYVAYGQRV